MEIRCRLCAEAYQNQIEIVEDSRFQSMLKYLFQLKLSLNDKMPSTVCQECYQSVERTWQFKEQIDKAQIILTQLCSVDTIRTDIIQNGATEVIFEEDTKINHPFEVINHTVAEHDSIPNEEEHEEIHIIHVKETNKAVKKVKKSKKAKSSDNETLKEIEYVNPDGSVVPKAGISGWDSYQWSCYDCNSIFQVSDELREHFATVHNSNTVRYPCMDCSKVYSKYTTFISHVKFHQSHLKYSCDICYKWYGTEKEVDVHRTTHYEERPYQCSTCDELKNLYHCNECPKKFGTKPNLMAHKRIHLGIRNYTCNQCGKSFVLKGNLHNHMLTHNTARPFNCVVCGKSFKTLIRLRKHSTVHSGLKPHRCDICGRQFRERGTLKDHHRIHTGAMPFTCEFCGKCFRFKGVLTTHRRQHTGERPYSCNECQHHFTNWPNYNKHMKRRHGINTSVNCRTRQDIPPTGKPHRNPPGTVLAPPQTPLPIVLQQNATPIENFQESQQPTFYPVVGLYGIPDDLLQQRV
ncbi:hypothetical protein GWI33_022444 [Rhynchophorus ferrugineus]|uniref:Zinc finger protein 865 n=1 Tax=Rhynchophorus ferrugineus TaxID=354439 RepID=A0A834ISD8_RHYFE|nr:hypothetical protein GWI33_022444 [Rhynchophorus ferrugineus]